VAAPGGKQVRPLHETLFYVLLRCFIILPLKWKINMSETYTYVILPSVVKGPSTSIHARSLGNQPCIRSRHTTISRRNATLGCRKSFCNTVLSYSVVTICNNNILWFLVVIIVRSILFMDEKLRCRRLNEKRLMISVTSSGPLPAGR